MRGGPPLELTVRRFGRWRGALVLLSGAGLAVTAWWWLAAPPPRPGWTSALAALSALMALLPLAEALRLRPLALRWDGDRWHVAAPAAPVDAPCEGRMQVALDLGDWLLLRFVADRVSPAPSPWGGGVRVAWIALQRSGIENHWHALRYALYSPPSAEPPGGAPARSTE